MKIIIFLLLLSLIGCTTMVPPVSKPAPMEKHIPIPATVRGHGDEIKDSN